MEAMACGAPTVGFRVGVIPEMIDHMKNGYVAKTRDAADLAAGLRWALFEADAATVQAEALRKVRINYSQNRVAMKYIEIYNHELALRHYIT
jgi:glycosyltransferase involved in cell wall biosynthesis